MYTCAYKTVLRVRDYKGSIYDADTALFCMGFWSGWNLRHKAVLKQCLTQTTLSELWLQDYFVSPILTTTINNVISTLNRCPLWSESIRYILYWLLLILFHLQVRVFAFWVTFSGVSDPTMPLNGYSYYNIVYCTSVVVFTHIRRYMGSRGGV